MSGVAKKLMGTTAAGGGFTAIEDVFSTYLYTGNGSTQTITNGIDLAGEGGLVWVKGRNFSDAHALFDTERGFPNWLVSNATIAENAYGTPDASDMVANSNGFSVNNISSASNSWNSSGNSFASWTFRKAPRFFDVVTYTGDGVAGRAIPHNLSVAAGFIIVKRTDTTSNWKVNHRVSDVLSWSLNSNSTYAIDQTIWNYTAPTSTHFTVGSSVEVNASGGTYVAYLFAHDPLGPSGDGSDGLIDCGSYGGNGSVNGPVVSLGFEPQWLLIKAATGTGNWHIIDAMRGMPVGSADATLQANLSAAESSNEYISPTATGFQVVSTSSEVNAQSISYIYIAIRRGPMRAPESGTEVFAPVSQLSGGTVTTDFAVDLSVSKALVSGTDPTWIDRLRGGSVSSYRYLVSSKSDAEASGSGFGLGLDNNTGYKDSLFSLYDRIYWNFRRAPNFFDVVAYTGDGVAGRTVPHNLGVAPEMMIIKRRDSAGDWLVFRDFTPPATSKYAALNIASFFFTDTNSLLGSNPTETEITLNGAATLNGSGGTYIAYLFATLAGVSKVGSYTGNGTSQTIDCGFTTGARFVLIKRSDFSGEDNHWYVWDTARGIVTGNDPHLSLNTTAAEVTTDDSIDPDSSGFIVNQVAATNINVSAASYIFYAIA